MISQVHNSLFDIALDIGHSSIGWAVFCRDDQNVQFDLLGTGVVLFSATSCLANVRRQHRQQRRNIRAKRQRIACLKQLLHSVGVLSMAELNQVSCASPWKLAAATLAGDRLLSWPELWDVLRWYAHNRGYDGNVQWQRKGDCENKKTIADNQKEANNLMSKHHVDSMAQTCYKIFKHPSKERCDKLKSAVFKREVVAREIQSILDKHLGKLPNLTNALIETLIGTSKDSWKTIAVPTVHLQKRYEGSYLFGQKIPRFDNRIISSCPITYAKVFNQVLEETGDFQQAQKQAILKSKVPAKKCREFLLYRWVMVLANIKVIHPQTKEIRNLTAEERKKLHQFMIDTVQESKEGLSKAEFRKKIETITCSNVNNFDAYFMLPEAEQALTLRPRRNSQNVPMGRAPYTREVMLKAIAEVFEGKHPMEKDNCLYRTKEINDAQWRRPLDEKTNNHLVRHRILIARRLLRDIITDYAFGDASKIGKITIEVNKDLKSFSGMNQEEIGKEYKAMYKNHQNALNEIQKAFKEEEFPASMQTLIRKVKIAQDLNWQCPYTGCPYTVHDLIEGRFDKDHIIPQSMRQSDALESFVITLKEINHWKGKRTALQFIQEYGGQDILGTGTHTLWTKKQFEKFVNKLNTKGDHPQDNIRKQNRKRLLLMDSYEETVFLPKDLTQTSHLVRLAIEELKKEFIHVEHKPYIATLPGAVTGVIRKQWNLYSCIAANDPEVQKLLERQKTERLLNIKHELRNMTDQHHALDACVIGYAAYLFPNQDNLWEILLKRNHSPKEKEWLVGKGIFIYNKHKQCSLVPFNATWRQQVTQCLKERRIIQYIPKGMGGLKIRECTSGIEKIELTSNKIKGSKKPLEQIIWDKNEKQPLPHLGDLQHENIQIYLKNGGVKKMNKTLGLIPKNRVGKLEAVKGIRVFDENFGIVVLKKLQNIKIKVIRWHQVWKQLQNIANDENEGKWPDVFRKGQLINVQSGMHRGFWKIVSIKDGQRGVLFDIKCPWNKKQIKNGISVVQLLKDGMALVKSKLTGASMLMSNSINNS